MWFLEGGPGGDGFELLPLVAPWLPSLPKSDVIMPDHRGTGFSSRLVCEDWVAAAEVRHHHQSRWLLSGHDHDLSNANSLACLAGPAHD